VVGIKSWKRRLGQKMRCVRGIARCLCKGNNYRIPLYMLHSCIRNLFTAKAKLSSFNSTQVAVEDHSISAHMPALFVIPSHIPSLAGLGNLGTSFAFNFEFCYPPHLPQHDAHIFLIRCSMLISNASISMSEKSYDPIPSLGHIG